MSIKLSPPVLGDNYERYKQELEAWRIITDVPQKKQGITIALTLPDDHPSGIRGRVFEEIEVAKLGKGTGLATLLAFMDKQLGKDDITDTYENFEEFEDFRRADNMSIATYVNEFHQRYNRLIKRNLKLPTPILAFKLLKGAKLTKEERMLVLTGMNFEEQDKLYDQAKASLKKFMSEFNSKNDTAVKFDPAFLAEHEEALWAAGYVKKARSQRKYENDGSSWEEKDAELWRGNEKLDSDDESLQKIFPKE